MSKINVLDSSIFNRIAAGEVVENPRSIVKELVENSIDAEADTITVEIRNGGISYICVTDNGKGIDKEDIPLAFMPHATSKISNVKDLENISTLGFRGEALPSIASVAEVELCSRTQENELGYKISIHCGTKTDEGECGGAYGTKVTVKNIFTNIPARAKFLRKPQMEESSVTEFIAKMILANPFLKFKYTVDGKTHYQSDGNGVESAIFSIYGEEFLSNLEPISYIMPDITLTGFICKPNYTKHNRNYQTLVVNGRYIVNQDISYCIQQSYSTYLMKRQFPAFVLYLDIPSDMVDVNVHPNKMDVRFVNDKRLKGIIYNTVKNKIDSLALNPVSFSPVQSFIHESSDSNVQNSTGEAIQSFNLFANKQIEHNTEIDSEEDIGEFNLFKPTGKTTVSEPSFISSRLNNFSGESTPSATQQNHDSYDYIAATQDYKQDNYLFGNPSELKYVGKLFNTYIISESGNDFYIIDQHAAHEKLLYDKLSATVDAGNTALQYLLVPYIFDVSPTEKVMLCDNLDDINNCGFKIDYLNGLSFSLYALPVCCADMDLKKFVSLLLDNSYTQKKNSTFIKEKLMQAACKSAVKGEMDLSQSEIDSLIIQMQQTESARFCPHGRPTVIKLSKYDIEKLFKRV